MSKEQTTVWKCDLCRQTEQSEELPSGWIQMHRRGVGADLCDDCVSEVLSIKDAYCH